MPQHLLLIRQHEPKDLARQLFRHLGFDRHGRVKTQGPFAVTATQCSK